MAYVEKVSIALTPEMAAAARTATEAGEFASTSEVVRDAMREWVRRREERARAIKELGTMWDAGLASGAARDGEKAFARIRAGLESHIASRGHSGLSPPSRGRNRPFRHRPAHRER